MGKKIGSAKEVDGLYYLEEEPEALISLSLVDKIVSQVPNENEISLLHLRLGHPNFSYLKLFPMLSKNKRDIIVLILIFLPKLIKFYNPSLLYIVMYWVFPVLPIFLKLSGLTVLLMIILECVGCIY